MSNHPNLPFLDSSSTGLSTTLALESLLTGRGASAGALVTGAAGEEPFTAAGGAAGAGCGGWGATAGAAAVPFMAAATRGGRPLGTACAVGLLKNWAIPG